MTVQEAIEMLKTICGDCRLFPKCAYKKSECFTALDMAIEALTHFNSTSNSIKNELNDDLISRQSAIDALEKLSANYTAVGKREWHPHVRECQKEIECLPSAQPEQGCDECVFKPFKQFQPERKKGEWIPCSERLPEEGIDVLLAYEKNMVVGNWEDICGDVTWYANSGDGWFTATEDVDNDGIPIAWMPLPEPYRRKS